MLHQQVQLYHIIKEFKQKSSDALSELFFYSII